MHTHTDKAPKNKSNAVANNSSGQESKSDAILPLTDNRTEAIAQRKMLEIISNSPYTQQLKARQEMVVQNSGQVDVTRNEAIVQSFSANQPTHRKTLSQSNIAQRVIYKKEKGEWKPLQEKDKEGKESFPKDAPDGTWFNNVTGESGKTLNMVNGNSPYGKETAPMFQQLIKLIDQDDAKEDSTIPIEWKQQVLKDRNNEDKLLELSKKTGKPLPPKELDLPKPTFPHGEIGEFSINDDDHTKDRLETKGNLLSGDTETRKKAVAKVRGSDEVYSQYQGAILHQFIAEERKAILALVHQAKGASAVFSLERGGSIIADLMERVSQGTMAPNIKVAKPTKEDVIAYSEKTNSKLTEIMLAEPANQKQVHTDMFKFFIKQYIEQQQLPEITIAITETAVGGGSVNSMANTVIEICDELKESKTKVKFKILVARETIKNTNYKGSGILKLHDPINITKNDGINPKKELQTDNPHEVEMYISQTRYLIGEDVDYQLKYSGGNSGKPVIVFDEDERGITAISITPAEKGDSARQVIIDLVAGAYDQLMHEIFKE